MASFKLVVKVLPLKQLLKVVLYWIVRTLRYFNLYTPTVL